MKVTSKTEFKNNLLAILTCRTNKDFWWFWVSLANTFLMTLDPRLYTLCFMTYISWAQDRNTDNEVLGEYVSIVSNKVYVKFGAARFYVMEAI